MRRTTRSTPHNEQAELADRLHGTAIHLLRRLRREDAASGLSAARLSALSVLVFGGARTVGELAAAEQVTPPTMTRLVAALETEDYVKRRADESDGRVVIVEATPRAKQALEAGRARRVRALVDMLGDLTPAEWKALAVAIPALEQALTT